MLSRADLKAGQLVLDVGCGTGVLEERLRGISVIGVDLTEEMVRLAKEKRIGSLSLSVGDGENLPFRDGTFDSIVSCYVAKYCSTKALLEEMARVLKPGGKLVMYDFSSPKGAFAPFHALYVYGGLRLFGSAIRLVDPELALTYEALPEVIRSRLWDREFDAALLSAGFRDPKSQRLTGGAVTGFWATKS